MGFQVFLEFVNGAVHYDISQQIIPHCFGRHFKSTISITPSWFWRLVMSPNGCQRCQGNCKYSLRRYKYNIIAITWAVCFVSVIFAVWCSITHLMIFVAITFPRTSFRIAFVVTSLKKCDVCIGLYYLFKYYDLCL